MAAQAQRGLVEFAQELEDDDVHVRMPDVVQRSSWRRQFKSHDKAKKRLMTGAEAAEKDANKREEEADRERRLREREAQTLSFGASEPLLRPPPPTSSEDKEEEKEEEEEEEQEVDEALILPPSTAPVALQVSRAGRKRAPTMKALEAETAPKRRTGQGTGRGRGHGGRAAK